MRKEDVDAMQRARDGARYTRKIIRAREKEAKARLIAAAPDLLVALKEAQQWLTSIIDGGDLLPEDRETLERIDAAIAKAEGKV